LREIRLKNVGPFFKQKLREICDFLTDTKRREAEDKIQKAYNEKQEENNKKRCS
jgi:hypothetical protein